MSIEQSKTEGEELPPESQPKKQKTFETLKSLLVNVLQEHIDKAMKCPCDPSKCMISRAIRDAIKALGLTPCCVLTDLQTIRFSIKEFGKRFMLATPLPAFEELVMFDNGAAKPFTFRMGLVHAVQIHDMYKELPPRTEGKRRQIKPNYSMKHAVVTAPIAEKGKNKNGDTKLGITKKARIEGGPLRRFDRSTFSYPANVRVYGKRILLPGSALEERLREANPVS